jgi:hypothetical protein
MHGKWLIDYKYEPTVSMYRIDHSEKRVMVVHEEFVTRFNFWE